MKKHHLLATLTLVSLLATGAYAQRGGGGGGGGGGSADPGNARGFGDIPVEGAEGSDRARAAAPKPKSPEEGQAVQSVMSLYSNDTTTPDQMNGAIEDFLTKYPKSDYVGQVNKLGAIYSDKHGDFAKQISYGQAALKTLPDDLYLVTSLGAAIPAHVAETDPDGSALLKAAEDYNKKALSLTDAIQIQGGRGATIDGKHYTAEQAQQVKSSYTASSRRNLGKVYLVRTQYSQAADQFQKAIAADGDDLSRAGDYLNLAQAQAGERKPADASASLDKADSLAGSNDDLKKAIGEERAKVKGGN